MKDPRFGSPLVWRTRMPGKPTPDPEYLDSPYLTLAINVGSALGLFLGAWMVIYLIHDLERHRGFATYWPLILILVVDAAVNVALRLIRAHRRAADPDSTPGPLSRHVRSHGDPASAEWRDGNDERRA